MGAIEAKVYKGNTALAAKRGVFVYSTFYFTTFTLFLHLLVHHTFIWNIPPFFISFFLHTISLGFHFRAKYLDQIMLGFLIDGVASLPIFSRLRKATQRERERERERGREQHGLSFLSFFFFLVYMSLWIWISGHGQRLVPSITTLLYFYQLYTNTIWALFLGT
ncbi:uncharacterized protein TrAFT101_001293 [Trichoderma asperellum]|uniref:uncharacterized protein n=1 Tax=Trichoderma asperellum TaxID=101201 RepID=UPI00331DC0EE|nr:hypothetical protein TrAFT101_001293 [Trichoderma asperellum]